MGPGHSLQSLHVDRGRVGSLGHDWLSKHMYSIYIVLYIVLYLKSWKCGYSQTDIT